MLVAPSLLAADFSSLGEELKRVSEGGADWIHIDVMDGHFVPNITIGPPVVKALRSKSDLFFDVHLMIERPENYIEDFAKAGADLITVHAEATHHLPRLLSQIKEAGVKCGVALNPATPLQTVEWVLGDVDLVLIMSVNPGFGGQTFLPLAVPKIERMKQMIDDSGSRALLEVDGGINQETAPLVVKAGVDVIVAGSYVFNASNIKEAVQSLKNCKNGV